VLSYADLTLDARTYQVRRNGKLIPLALKEFSVLECLLREPGRVLTRAQIAEHVWSYENFNQSNVVDVYVRNLRRKIDEPFEQKLIYTVRGVGYCLAVYETD
jgi:DNA-binding response OmpR family regulator